MFDALIRDVGSRFGLGNQAASLVQSLISYLFREQPGMVSGLVDQFRKAGLGDVISSWTSGTPREVTSDRIESVLGTDAIR